MQPIGFITASETSNRLSLYMEEILLTEGYNGYDTIDLSKETLDPNLLSGRPLIIVDHSAAGQLDWSLVESYVLAGGALIAVRPPVECDFLFGLKRNTRRHYIRTVDGYLVFNRGSRLTIGLAPDAIQFIGAADLYEANGAECLAMMTGAPQPESASVYPGVAVHRYGEGHAAIFTYDLSECIVKLHQGDPGFSSLGARPDPDGDGKYEASELFRKQFDFNLRFVPQADVHQDIFVRILRLLTQDRIPLPRLWHFPGGAASVAFINGDSDRMNPEEFERTVQTVARYGGKYTCYMMDGDQAVVPAKRAQLLRANGHDFGPHLYCGLTPTLEEMKDEIARAVESFKRHYGFQPLSHRGHCAIWVGWTEMAEALREAGIRLDTNFRAASGIGEGFINGSGLPVRFMNEAGKVIDLYEQSTQLTDDLPFSSKPVLKVKSREETIASSFAILNSCLRYHGVFHPYYHPIHTGPRGVGTMPIIEQVLQGCEDLGIPFVNGAEWVAFNDARRGVRYSDCGWDAAKGVLTFEMLCDASVADLTVLLPPLCGKAGIRGVSVNQADVPCEVTRELEGFPWAKVTVHLEAGKPILVRAKYESMQSQIRGGVQ